MKNKISFWTAIVSGFLLVLGAIGSVFAPLGICAACTIPFVTFLLSLAGLVTGILSDYNYWFLGAGIFFLILTIYLVLTKKKCKKCKA